MLEGLRLLLTVFGNLTYAAQKPGIKRKARAAQAPHAAGEPFDLHHAVGFPKLTHDPGARDAERVFAEAERLFGRPRRLVVLSFFRQNNRKRGLTKKSSDLFI